MKKTVIVISLLILLNVVSFLTYRHTPLNVYDYSNCPNLPNVNCAGVLVKTNWTAHLPIINLAVIVFLIILLVFLIIYKITKNRQQKI